MFDQLYWRIRGVDCWAETNAVVTARSIYSEGGVHKPSSVSLSFSYPDQNGASQYGNLIADSLTSLYSIEVGDTFPIRFNPKQQEQFYCEEASSFFTEMKWGILLIVGIGAVIVVFVLVQMALRRQ
jgi:hypothetical protein